MAIYHRHKVQQEGGEALCTAWSYPAAGAPALAVGTAGGAVNIYDEEGQRVYSDGQCVLKRTKDPVALAWHPQQRLLAIGWKDGAISFFKESEKRMLDDTSCHRKAITCLIWNAEGTRLISGDEEGRVGIWRADQRGRPTVVTKYLEKTEGRIGSICFDTNAAPAPEFIDPALPPPCPPFYYSFSTKEKGMIYHADDKGKKVLAYEVDGPVMATLYYPERNGLVVITADFTLTVHIRGTNTWSLQTKVKLNKAADVAALEALWAGPHVLALAADKDSVLRMSDLETEENFVLQVPEAKAGALPTRVLALAYNTPTRTLAAALKDGRMALWKQVGERPGPAHDAAEEVEAQKQSPEQLWQAQAPLELSGTISDLVWSSYDRLTAAVTSEGIYVLSQSSLAGKVRDKLALIQVAGGQVSVEATDSQNRQVLTSELQITGVDVSDTHALIWGGRGAEVYEIGMMGLRQISAFEIASGAQLAIHHDSVFRTRGTTVEICTLEGTVKQTLLLDEVHGDAAHLSACEDFLAVATSHGFIKMWKIGGREAKPYGPSLGRKVEVDGVAIGDIQSIRCNCNGTKVSILARRADEARTLESRIIVYDTELDAFLVYDFRPFHRRPVSHQWDGEEPKLLACETQLDRAATATDGLRLGSSEKDLQVVTLFSSPDHGILYQDKIDLADDLGGLVGLHVPYLYFYAKPSVTEAKSAPLLRPVVMRDFQGMENVDAKTRSALVGFGFHLAVGNMDEAYKTVKLIKNPAVWENMAHLCVKTKRLDVAQHCLGNMGHARAAKALREAQQEPEVDARVAIIAVQLGLLDDAQKLYANCERWDLLNELYQALGDWQRALEVASKQDRIHLRPTYYKYARHLEGAGDIAGAIKAYQLAGSHQYEVPRMLHDLQHLEDLEAYVQSSGDKELVKWWAQYCESQGHLDKALHCYDLAGDYLSQVRLWCHQGDFASATELVDRSADSAAAFYLARQLEASANIPQALNYFTKAGRAGHAVKLAQQFGMDSELLGLALQAPPPVMLSTAAYFEEKAMFEKAVLLYQKGGNLSRAVEICFRGQLFDSLRMIADNLKEDADPALLARCADFFLQHNQFEKAVHLLIAGKKLHEALDLCMEHGVIVTEEMAEALTPAKTDTPEDRVSLLKRIAKCCKEQGSYHVACKKYTQAGEKTKAMRVLLKSGDTEKIIFFANVSRQKELYVLAANYLQSLNWHSEPETMKAIIQFYTKAGAMEQLSSFYEACAQIEIDEYRDYEKALGALREGLKYLSKAKGDDKDARVASLTNRISLVERFVQARKLEESDPKQMFMLCRALIEQVPAKGNDLESTIRVGDVFAHLIEYCYNQGEMEQAYQLTDQMRDCNILLGPYLDNAMVHDIYKAMGIDHVEDSMPDKEEVDDIGEEIEDE